MSKVIQWVQEVKMSSYRLLLDVYYLIRLSVKSGLHLWYTSITNKLKQILSRTNRYWS